MITQFNGFEEAKKAAQRKGTPKLPAGPYVCKILNTKNEAEKGFLKVQFDVAEGEYKDFFTKAYKESTDENKKFKGVLTLWLPKDDGSEKDKWTKDKFASFTNALEESNNGYKWDWHEEAWKGKTIGLMFGEVGKNINGKDVTFTEYRYPISVAFAKSGKAKTPDFYAYKGYGEAAKNDGATDFMNVPDGIQEELPF